MRELYPSGYADDSDAIAGASEEFLVAFFRAFGRDVAPRIAEAAKHAQSPDVAGVLERVATRLS
jgi:hypothetical protein